MEKAAAEKAKAEADEAARVKARGKPSQTSKSASSIATTALPPDEGARVDLRKFGGVYQDTYPFAEIDCKEGDHFVLYYPQDGSSCEMPCSEVSKLTIYPAHDCYTHVKYGAGGACEVKVASGAVFPIQLKVLQADVASDKLHDWFLER